MSDPVYPQWRKVLLSGSNAYVHALTASGLDLSPGDPATEKVLVVGTGGAIYYTGSYGSGGGGGGTADDIATTSTVASTAKRILLGDNANPTDVFITPNITFTPNPGNLTVAGDISATWISASSGIQHSNSDTKITLSDNLVNLSALGSGDPFTVTIQGDTGGGDTVELLITASDTSQGGLHLKSLRPYIWFEEYDGSPDFYLYQKTNGLHLGTNAIDGETITFYPSLGSISGSGDFEINDITSSGYVTITEGITSNGEALIKSSSDGDFTALTIKNQSTGIDPSVSLKFIQGSGTANAGRISSERDGEYTAASNATAGLHFYTVFQNVETASLILSSSGLVSIPGFISSSGTSDTSFGGRIVLDNATYFAGTQADTTTTRNLLGIDASNIAQIGNTNIVTNLKGSSITINGPITNAITASIISASGNISGSSIHIKGTPKNIITGENGWRLTGGTDGSNDIRYLDLTGTTLQFRTNGSAKFEMRSQNSAEDDVYIHFENSDSPLTNVSLGTVQKSGSFIIARDEGFENNIDFVITGSNGYIGIGEKFPGEKLTVSGSVSASGHLYASTSYADPGDYNNVVLYDTATGKFYHTGSYGGGGGGGTPGGSNTQVQFNKEGVFGGDAQFTFISSSNLLTIGDNSTSGRIAIQNSDGTSAFAVIGGSYIYSTVNYLLGAVPSGPIPEILTVEGNISSSGNLYIQSGSAAYTDIVYSSQFTTASYLYFDDDLNPEQSANNTTLASIAGMNFIMDTNNNDVHQFYWSYGGLTPATSTPIMTLDRNGQLSGSTLSFIGKAGNFASDVTAGSLTTDVISASGMSTGEDNSVVILDADGVLKTDEIDSRVWGSSLVDYSGTPASSQVAIFNDSNTISSDNTLAFSDGTLRIGGKAGASDTHVLYMPPILGSTIWENYKSGIEVNASDFNAERQSTGEIFNAINTSSLTATEIVYYGKAGWWVAADAATPGPASGMLGLAINTGPTQTAALTKGYMAVAASQIGGTYTTGSSLYLGTSSGMFQASAPRTIGHTIRKVGWVVNGSLGKTGTDVLVHFNPSSDFITN